ncbi:MAG: tRNA lysidine(34) synthetase TilS [Candidatus Omnitrophica bacterium]|nr:tRNA lysidine(34) synthetase TilS [Candidatus Omnitrophota bacterium]
MQILTRIQDTVDRHDMFERGDSVLVCVSGGSDSVFLLHALLRLKKRLGITLFVANMDHGIRGRASSRDSDFVRALTRELGLKFFHKKLKFEKKKKLSVEETARYERYKFFESVAYENNLNKIVTAHTADDLAETVLMRIIKGTSLKGIIGIPPKRTSTSAMYVRPLIDVEKDEILRFLKSQKIHYVVDITNNDNKYFRNTVRNTIIPELSRYNPRLKRSLVNLAESLREDKEFIDSAKEKISNIIEEGRSCVSLRLKDIVIQPRAIQKEITRDALMKAGSDIKKLNFRHWKEISALIRLKPCGKSLDLPGGIRLAKKRDMLTMERHSTTVS